MKDKIGGLILNHSKIILGVYTFMGFLFLLFMVVIFGSSVYHAFSNPDLTLTQVVIWAMSRFEPLIKFIITFMIIYIVINILMIFTISK